MLRTDINDEVGPDELSERPDTHLIEES